MANTQWIELTPETTPPSRRRGHLSLVEWRAEAPKAATPKRASLDHQAIADRFYMGGVLLLIAATAYAVVAGFTRL